MADWPINEVLYVPPALQSSVFCLGIHWEAEGCLTMYGAFHTLPAGSVPDFYLVNVWRLDQYEAREYQEILELRDPDGRVLGQLRTKPYRLGGDQRYRFSCIRFADVFLKAGGPHEVQIRLVDMETKQVVARAATPLGVV